ncbi:MAG: ribosome small subunit-dependent GTPase A [Roseburia sp.]|nr:ribosome small subunit-dependent GTPase A [Roseburia sp.]MCM1278527.1 ribosome small subunit-dependent GTPase A [Robinsoniella sp.]
MQGKIIKGIGGFYYVHLPGRGLYECKAKGLFRKMDMKPFVGDDVEIQILDENAMTGNITSILPRKNQLIRPAVSNVDQAMVIFSVVKPEPNFHLLNSFLVMMERQQVPCIICLNKADIALKWQIEEIEKNYQGTEYPLFFVSAKEKKGIEKIKDILLDKTTTVAGPSGVGKSSLINSIQKDVTMETGDISKKIERGRHTTRHSELIALEEGGYIMDTPGFSSLSVDFMEKEEIKEYFPEFLKYEPECRFQGCAHIHEPECGVKNALKEGMISRVRYDDYVMFYEQCKEKRRY